MQAALPIRPHHAHWPPRLPHRIPVPATPLPDNLAVNARRYPDHTAIVFLGRRWSYAELQREVERLAGWLFALGVQRGDRVLVCMQNCPQLVIAHYAILRANAVVVPVNPMNRATELAHAIADPDAQVALTTADLAGELARASADLPAAEQLAHLVVTRFTDCFDPTVFDTPGDVPPPPGWRAWLTGEHPLPTLAHGAMHRWADLLGAGVDAPAAPPLVVGADDLAVLPYTSGTTGLPKGCMHPHRTLMHNAVAGALWGTGHAQTVSLAVVPMFHITGMVSVLHTCIYAGATLVLMPRWDRDYAGRLISHHRVSSWVNIPTMVIDLLASPDFAAYDLSSLQYIGGGGAAMPQAVAQRLWEQYGLRYQEGYGLTETAAPTHTNPAQAPKQQCLGIPIIGTDARVVDPETLAELPVGETGEIIARGPGVFSGYWKNPQATEAAFVDFEGQRFFRTGDIGRMDADGYFFLTDRLKRMINASGFKVWPAEVESLMFRHPAVAEACVIATRDAYRGESVKAVVVRRAGHEGLDEQALIAWCREHMAVYKAPRTVQFVDALPKSGSGKVMWRALQEAEN